MQQSQRKTRKDRGLGKYDAPLKFQHNQGYVAFKRGKLSNPFSADTMQYREWERGFNQAYFEQQKRVVSNERAKTGSGTILKGEV